VFENSRFSPSVTAASSSASERRHRSYRSSNAGVADIEAEAARVDDDLGQRRDVADADIEPLAGDRVDHMRRLADQRQAAAT